HLEGVFRAQRSRGQTFAEDLDPFGRTRGRLEPRPALVRRLGLRRAGLVADHAVRQLEARDRRPTPPAGLLLVLRQTAQLVLLAAAARARLVARDVRHALDRALA